MHRQLVRYLVPLLVGGDECIVRCFILQMVVVQYFELSDWFCAYLWRVWKEYLLKVRVQESVFFFLASSTFFGGFT